MINEEMKKINKSIIKMIKQKKYKEYEISFYEEERSFMYDDKFISRFERMLEQN
jgi:hypothetical protein